MKTYVNPCDPSSPANYLDSYGEGITGYAANWQVFGSSVWGYHNAVYPPLFNYPTTLSGIFDGTSNTIGVGERYAQCCKSSGTIYNSNSWAYGASEYSYYSFFSPVFANANLPQATGTAAMFQSNPTWNDLTTNGCQCDWTRLQAPRSSGILVGLMDGSTRLVSSSVSPTTWWNAITPKGGEIQNADW